MQNSITQKQKALFAILAILIVPISGLAIDIYAPSLPNVAHSFNVSKSLAQLTITTYMIGLGVMQLFAGSISDSFGRRKPFLIASIIFLIATLTIPHVYTIHQLLALRFIQGVAVAVTVVPIRSIIPDLFEGKELYKWMNYMVMAWSTGPIIAPMIGGYLQHFFGWKSNFYFLFLYTVITGLIFYLYVPETSKHRHTFHIIDILKRYKIILTHPDYITTVLMNGLLYSIIIVFTIIGPFLIQVDMNYTAIEFGKMALLVGLFWFLGTMTNRFLIAIPNQKKFLVCLVSMLLVAIEMLIAASYYEMNVYVLLIPLLLMGWLGGIIFPNNIAKAVSLFPTMTGSANALSAGLIFITTSITSSLATYLKSTTLVPLSLTYIGMIIVCLFIFAVNTLWHSHQTLQHTQNNEPLE
jgi:DHA1 family bicyclomycin/chloramphenicol resistance-like MFS transporter